MCPSLKQIDARQRTADRREPAWMQARGTSDTRNMCQTPRCRGTSWLMSKSTSWILGATCNPWCNTQNKVHTVKFCWHWKAQLLYRVWKHLPPWLLVQPPPECSRVVLRRASTYIDKVAKVSPQQPMAKASAIHTGLERYFLECVWDHEGTGLQNLGHLLIHEQNLCRWPHSVKLDDRGDAKIRHTNVMMNGDGGGDDDVWMIADVGEMSEFHT